MAEGTRAYRRIGTRDPAAQRLARTLAQTEQVLTNGRRDRLLFHNLWGGRWARVFGGGSDLERYKNVHHPRAKASMTHGGKDYPHGT